MGEKVEIEGVRPIWRDPQRNSAPAGLIIPRSGWMGTQLVTKRCDLGSRGVPGAASTPLGSQDRGWGKYLVNLKQLFN